MKKILLFGILTALTISVGAQIKASWTDSVKVPLVDTVKGGFPTGYAGLNKDISAYDCTVEFDMKNLDGTVTVNFGGGHKIIRATPRLYSFTPFRNDSLPYSLSNTAWRDTVNGVAQNVRSFQIYKWGYYWPGIFVQKGTCTAGLYLIWQVKCY